ncbi:hypothetical protein HAX54_041185, partial [Datura stramonium]|nr:hypothetical protein [Datura stramonium]
VQVIRHSPAFSLAPISDRVSPVLFRKYVLRKPTHGFPENILLEKSCTVLEPHTQSVLGNAVG